MWAAREAETVFLLGCDDPVRLYVNGDLVFKDDGRQQPDPFKMFKPAATLREGLNVVRVVLGNTATLQVERVFAGAAERSRGR